MNYIQDHNHRFCFKGYVVKEEESGKVRKIFFLRKHNFLNKNKVFASLLRTISRKLGNHLNSILQYNILLCGMGWQYT